MIYSICRKLTRTTNTWSFAEYAKKAANCYVATLVQALTILNVAILHSRMYPMVNGLGTTLSFIMTLFKHSRPSVVNDVMSSYYFLFLVLVVPWLRFKARWRKF